MTAIAATAEGRRLEEDRTRQRYWKRWGPYVSARQWGTVREDYSADGDAWLAFGHDQARSRAYRWGEDGIAGVCDNHQRLCFALTLWNGQDDILKERLFGLTNGEGNHGEDVKEYYFYLDNTPTHSYMKLLYKYPQAKFPYRALVEENARRGADPNSPEFELLDTGVFDQDRYFDVFVEYAKSAPEELLVRLRLVNRGPEARRLHVLPTLWFRNTWSWSGDERPRLDAPPPSDRYARLRASHPAADLGERWLYCEGAPELLFTENETNRERFGWGANGSPHVKDGFEAYVLRGDERGVNPARTGTRAAAYYRPELPAGGEATLRLRLSDRAALDEPFGPAFDDVFATRQREADEFYRAVTPFDLPDDVRRIQRQAFAGLLWSKQYYHYVVRDWLDGDPVPPPPPPERKEGRNHEWRHLYVEDVLSMPDTWEYPWFAAWDLAFHAVALVLVDPELAKRQLSLLTREWYMHPNGQLPAYEWKFSDVNPPVHAWAAWRVYKIEQRLYGRTDREFLERVFHKLAVNFAWWVNRKDRGDNNIFEGGFLGLDNVGPFDRSTVPDELAGFVEQADGTGWVAMYCLNMLRIALELADSDPTYVEMATKFFQHFLFIAAAVNRIGGPDVNLWDDQDGFYYDMLHITDPTRSIDGREHLPLKVRSMVGLVPLFAVEAVDARFLAPGKTDALEEFGRRLRWLLDYRPELTSHENVAVCEEPTGRRGLLLSLVDPEKLRRILGRVLDPNEFLSQHGLRSVSKAHEASPFVLRDARGAEFRVDYAPAESRTRAYGGNSNWRGPVWFPVNFLMIESLQKWDRFFGDGLKVEYPTGSGQQRTLWEVSLELSRRLIGIFERGGDGRRPVYGDSRAFQEDPHWRDSILFFEYFHGDSGAGLGASHQTGWTALVAKLIQQWGEYAAERRPPRR